LGEVVFPVHRDLQIGSALTLPQSTNLELASVESSDQPRSAEDIALCERGDAHIQRLRSNQSARVFIISGPSGVGKDSVIEKLREAYPNAQYVVTATSRPMRPGEIDGVHYRFLDRADFERQIAEGDFLEHELVYENLYGVPRGPVVEGLRNNQHVIIKVDVKGAATLRTLISNTVSIFLLPETMESLKKRLKYRKTETPDVLMKRFRTACEELERVDEFDYAVFNEEGMLDEALKNIIAVVEAAHRKVGQGHPEIL
jgi:guanylate kinase